MTCSVADKPPLPADVLRPFRLVLLISVLFLSSSLGKHGTKRRAARPLRMLGMFWVPGSLGPCLRLQKEFPLFPPYTLADGNHSPATTSARTWFDAALPRTGNVPEGDQRGKGGEGRAANHPRENLINLPFGERCKSEKEVFDDDAVILWRCFRTALPDDVVRLRCAPAAAVAEHTDAHANYLLQERLTVLGAFSPQAH